MSELHGLSLIVGALFGAGAGDHLPQAGEEAKSPKDKSCLVAKKRSCGKCGRVFTTTPTRRFHCASCRERIRLGNLSPDQLC